MPVLDAVQEELIRIPPAAPPGGDDGLPPERPAREPAVSNARLGMLVFLAFESMFFAGLLGAYLVFRLGATAWPPPGEPYLPIRVTWVSTGILLFSSYTMRRGLRAIRQDDRDGLSRWLLVALGLSRGPRFSARRHAGVQLCAMYWHFVVGLWLVLFPAVYLL